MICGTNKKWDVNLIKNHFDNPMDVEDRCKIYIPRNPQENKRIWPFCENDQLTTKSSYKEIAKVIGIIQSYSYKMEILLEIACPQRTPFVRMGVPKKCYPGKSLH